jgi:hypothetical protein
VIYNLKTFSADSRGIVLPRLAAAEVITHKLSSLQPFLCLACAIAVETEERQRRGGCFVTNF